MRNYKKLSICPKQLKPIRDLVNQLPQDLKKFESDLTEMNLEFNREIENSMEKYDEMRSRFSNRLYKRISPKLKKYLHEIKAQGFINELIQLQILINEKITLETIIKSFEAFKSFNNPNQTFVFDKSIAAFGFNSDSTIQLSSFRIIEILTKNKIPIERVRICPMCKEFYWAKRLDSKTCGKTKCVENLGSAKYRKRNKEKINQRRRENYTHKQKLKEKRRVKNGNL